MPNLGIDRPLMHKNEFQEVIDAESLFVSTIIPSLNHTLMDWNMTDALWLLDPDILPKFHKMAELGRIVRVGFVEDLP